MIRLNAKLIRDNINVAFLFFFDSFNLPINK